MALPSFKNFLQSRASDGPGLTDASKWTRTGSRLGYNEGGEYDDESGGHHYMKFSHEDHVRTEHAATQIYNHLGLRTFDTQLVKHKGQVGLASKWQTGLKGIGDYGRLEPQQKADLADHHIAAAITMNHDHIGGYDNAPNISFDADNRIISHEAGGALGYGGIGREKHFGSEPEEIKTLRDPKYAAGRAFKHLSDSDVREAAGRVLPRYNPEHVAGVLRDAGVANHEQKAATLNARVEGLKKHFGMTW